MPRKKARKVIFQVKNKETNEKNNPPQIDTDDPNKYCAYFVNEVSEQFIFMYDYLSSAGTLWLNKNGWEEPIPVVNGKAQKTRLGESGKTWLKVCWKIATTIQQRREHHQKLITATNPQDKPIDSGVPSHEEMAVHMGHLYDALAQKGVAPNCSKMEFVSGWTGFIELIARLEAKYKDKLGTSQDNEP